MANQYVTGTTMGDEAEDDPQKRTLASGVNSGQSLQNMDPGKTPDPYSGAAQSVARTVMQRRPAAVPQAPASPYPASMDAARQSRMGPSASVPSQAMGQPPNPYIGASAPAPWQPPAPSPGPAPVATGVFNPQQFSDYGRLLLDQAQGKLTPAQQLADKEKFADEYYWGGMDAADKSAARGVGGVSGGSTQMQQAIAGNIAKAITAANAERATAAQGQFAGLLGQGMQQQQFEQNQALQQRELEQQAQQAFNDTMARLSGQQTQADIERQKIEAERNKPWWQQAATSVGNVVKSINPFGFFG